MRIREEILSTHGNTVITRNIYGAHCLNTPDVLFVDVDLTGEPPLKLTLLLVICTAYAWSEKHFGLFLGGVFVSIVGGVCPPSAAGLAVAMAGRRPFAACPPRHPQVCRPPSGLAAARL